MFGIFRKQFKIEPIYSMSDLEQRVQQLGFLPMFRSGIRDFSVYESTPDFWNRDDDGPWEWKGPMIQTGNVAYGKFFSRKAGYVSLEWLPDFINYRRTKHLAPNEDTAALDDIVLQTVMSEGQITNKELRELLGLSPRKRRKGEPAEDIEAVDKINLDTNLTRLMMEGRICTADFIYNIDKQGNRYGWGIAKYTTPEILYGSRIRATCTPEESYQRIFKHLRKTLTSATKAQITKLIG